MSRKKQEDVVEEAPQPCWPTWHSFRFYADDEVEAWHLRWRNGTSIARVKRHRLYPSIWYGEIGADTIGTRFEDHESAMASVETHLRIGSCERSPHVAVLTHARRSPGGV